jgi:hypothetical protein
VTCEVASKVLPSDSVPVAVSGCEVPATTEAWSGVIASPVKVALVTVTDSDALIPFSDAETSAVPIATPVVLPAVAPEAATVSTVTSDEPQSTLPVRSLVVPSENVPVAVTCAHSPTGMDSETGSSWMATSVADVAVTVALPLLPERVAVMVADPVASAVAVPCEPVALETLTFVASDEVHVARAVMSWVDPSE